MPEGLTDKEKAAIRQMLLAVWRFWHSDSLPEAESTVDAAIEAIDNLKKETDT